MQEKEWIDSLNLPDGSYKDHLEEILRPQEGHPFSLRKYRFTPEEFIPHPPFRLQDTHLSKDLTLTSVIHVPSLLDDLRKEFRLQFAKFLTTTGVPSTEAKHLPRPREYQVRIHGLSQVSAAYLTRTGFCSLLYATRMHLLSASTSWVSPLDFFRFSESIRVEECFIDEMMVHVPGDAARLAIPDFGLDEDTAQLIDPVIAEQLVASRRINAAPAMFTFYPPNTSGESIIDELHCSEPGFVYTFPSADGSNLPYLESTSAISSDWCESFWEKYVKTGPTCTELPNQRTGRKSMVWVAGPRVEKKEPELDDDLETYYSPVVSHFVQRAWNRAVEHDATFLLISCGSKERICIRHRGTNTLFMSDVVRADAGDYMITQLAFYSAFLRDHLARGLHPKPSLKRKHSDDTDNPDFPLKRPDHSGTPVMTAQGNDKTFDLEMANRPVVLLTFDMGVYRSSAPSTFLRQGSSCTPLPLSESFEQEVGGRECPVTKCVYLKLCKILGKGAEGIIYRATATLHLESGLTMEQSVVVKVAKMPYVTEYLKREYDMYWKLALAGVSEGILKVYGLFEDVEFGS
ncbi:hypothetical protein CVT24_001556, partial [Panaeolus cyanescens]